jgi:hypothetical protein
MTGLDRPGVPWSAGNEYNAVSAGIGQILRNDPLDVRRGLLISAVGIKGMSRRLGDRNPVWGEG